MGGLITFPGVSFYHGSKFALEGISEALGKEVKDFGIHVTAVEPGAFRTDWAGRSLVRAPRSIADYDAIFEPLRKHRMENSGHQTGDPKQAARAMLKIAASDNPPAQSTARQRRRAPRRRKDEGAAIGVRSVDEFVVVD